MAKEYEVLRVDEMSRTDDFGKVEKYHRVRLKTKGSAVITVNLDDKDYTEEKAIPILRAAAQETDKILASTG